MYLCIYFTLVIPYEINENAFQCIVLHSIIVLKKIPQNSKWDMYLYEFYFLLLSLDLEFSLTFLDLDNFLYCLIIII